LYPLLYALLGLALLAGARLLGVEPVSIDTRHAQTTELRGRGAALLRNGNAVLTLALLAAFWQGLSRLAISASHWNNLTVLALTTGVNLLAIAVMPASSWRRFYSATSVALASITFLTLSSLIQTSGWQKLELVGLTIGIALLAAGNIGRFRETGPADESVTASLWLGSLFATVPLVTAVLYHRFARGSVSLPDEMGLLTVTVAMLVTGYCWQVKSTTLLGGAGLTLYLILLIASVAYQPQVAVGVYLAVGGALLFSTGVVLSIYRDKLLALPARFASHQGIFSIIDWR
jgi:hypothetical protein